MSADLFADWKKEEENYASSNDANDPLDVYESPYSTNTTSTYSKKEKEGELNVNFNNLNLTSSHEDFEFESFTDPTTSGGKYGGINTDDRPMFEVREHGLKVSRRKGFTLSCLAVSNGIMTLGSLEGMLLRCTVDATDSVGTIEEIMIEPRVAIMNVFLDPSGAHLIVEMENGVAFYVHTSKTRPKKISKPQAMVITCVAWNRQLTSPASSNVILLGTDSGTVFEAECDGKDTKIIKKVYQIANQGPIAGIAFEQWHDSKTNGIQYYVTLSTSGANRRPTRMYQFIGGPTMEALFAVYVKNADQSLSFKELPGDIATAELQFYAKYENDRAKSFGVLTGDGVYHGELSFDSPTLDSVQVHCDLIPFPGKSEHAKNWQPPVAIAVTEYHVAILFPKYVQVISKLSNIVVFEEAFDSRVGTVHGIASDATMHTLWIHSDRRILEIVVVDEDRDVWKLYLQKAMQQQSSHMDPRAFETALSLCRNSYERAQVLTAQADAYFLQEDYEKAAVLYADTTRSFEEVALKFLEKTKTRDALRIFLQHKLRTLDSSEKTQKTVLCSWIVELFLEQFNALKGASSSASGSTSHDVEVDIHANLLYEFKQFLHDERYNLDPATTFNLIASHGRTDELVFYATLVEDYEKVVTYHIHRGDYGTAIEVLRSVETSKVAELYYKYSPELITYKPKELVEAWKHAETLDASRLIPSIVRLVHYDMTEELQSKGQKKTDSSQKQRVSLELAIRFLKFTIKQGNADATIHNYLLFLLAKHPDERVLIKFLRKHVQESDNSLRSGVLDIAFALRLCTQYKKDRACIYIYSAMGLYQDAVEKALQVDVKMAKEMANMPEDEDIRKKLWISIAKHTIDAGGEIREAMHLLKEASGMLKIEDILPFFPDFVQINEFKKEICESLEVYSDRIDQLKEEMGDYTQSAELIRTDMANLRKRCALVSGNQRCELTGQPILGSEFYLFPCSHAFQAAALKAEMQKHLNSFQRQTVKQLSQKLTELHQKLNSSAMILGGSGTSGASAALSLLQKNLNVPLSSAVAGLLSSLSASEKANMFSSKQSLTNEVTKIKQEIEMVQAKLDDIIASECIFCGDVMIKSIHLPFITPEDEAREGSEWAI